MAEETTGIRTMRTMAWERAKGELRSMIQTYWDNDNFPEFDLVVKEFIKRVEDNGLQE